jgi:hypothetical protein
MSLLHDETNFGIGTLGGASLPSMLAPSLCARALPRTRVLLRTTAMLLYIGLNALIIIGGGS